MIVLDTGVLAELISGSPAPAVVAWLDSVPRAQVATTAVTAATLLGEMARQPVERGRRLSTALVALLAEDLGGRVEPFDLAAARLYADIVAESHRRGRTISVPAAQIAAICRRSHASLATGNSEEFAGTGIGLVDPWASGFSPSRG